AEATGGRGSDDVRASTSGSGGDGGNGGNGASPGSGVAGGEGTGTPDDLADGADGQDGEGCDSPPPPPPSGDVAVDVDFSSVANGFFSEQDELCLPVLPVEETSVDTSQVRVRVTFDFDATAETGPQSLSPQSEKVGDALRLLGVMYLHVYLGACNDPITALQATQVSLQVLQIQAANFLLLQQFLGGVYQDVDSVGSSGVPGTVQGSGEGPSHEWRVANALADAITRIGLGQLRIWLNAETLSSF
ncbi:MAG: hypothetical protein GVY27_10075, partial [Deinococcus-Thermus bacterium]|nr:hypothetical protein [Deinococcota bacterium]